MKKNFSNQYEIGLFRESELKNNILGNQSLTIAELKDTFGELYQELMLLVKRGNYEAVYLFINTRLKGKSNEERKNLAHEIKHIFNLK